MAIRFFCLLRKEPRRTLPHSDCRDLLSGPCDRYWCPDNSFSDFQEKVVTSVRILEATKGQFRSKRVGEARRLLESLIYPARREERPDDGSDEPSEGVQGAKVAGVRTP